MTRIQPAVIVIAVISGGLAACDPNVAFKDYTLKQPEPVQFGCAMALDGSQASVRAKIVFGTVSDRRAHPRVAGQLRSGINLIDVPFDSQTEPRSVLEADLKRMLTAIGIEFTTDSPLSEGGIRLDSNLIEAYSELTQGWTNDVAGHFVFTLGLVRFEDEKILWTARFSGKYILEPVYFSSRQVSEAVNGAYCEALRKLVRITESESFRNALLDH